MVDDDPLCNQKNEKILRDASLTQNVKVTVNGGHALLFLDQITQIESNCKLLVLLDMDMPIMNGLEFLEYYRRSKTIPKENVLIVVQGDDLASDVVEKAKKLGATHFTSKSICINHLTEIVNCYFDSGNQSMTSVEEITTTTSTDGNKEDTFVYNDKEGKHTKSRNRTAA